MSEDNDEGSGEGKIPKFEVKVTGETKKLQEMEKELAAIKSKYEKEVVAVQTKLKDAENTEKERDELKATLADLAQKDFEDRKAELMKMVEQDKEILGEEKVKEINEAIKTPEDLDRTVFMVKTLNDALVMAREQSRKELEEKGYTFEANMETGKGDSDKKKPSGVVELTPRKLGDIFNKSYENAQDMVDDLLRAERVAREKWEKDPSEQNFEEYQKYKKASDNLFAKYIAGEVKRYKTGGQERWEASGKGREGY